MINRLKVFVFSLFVSFSLVLSAQEASLPLENYMVTVAGEQIIVSGFKPLTKRLEFLAVLYSKDLKEIARYSGKTIPGLKSCSVSNRGNNFFFTFLGTKDKVKYLISLDQSFNALFTGVPPENTSIKKEGGNPEENIEWVYKPAFNNFLTSGNSLLDIQLGSITCYTITDADKGIYSKKWETDLSAKLYIKFNLIDIKEGVAYFYAVQRVPYLLQTFLAINIDNGKTVFSTDLLIHDSLAVVSISNILVREQKIYAAGTYTHKEELGNYSVNLFRDDAYRSRGFDSRHDFFMSPASGYFIMTIDPKTGLIGKMISQAFPSLNKTVDHRIYRMAICQGIHELKNGKMMAFFEIVSSSKNGAGFSGLNSSSNSAWAEDTEFSTIRWEIDAFTSLFFNNDLSKPVPATMAWLEDVVEYRIQDYDIFTLKPRTQMPPEYCTLDEGGYYMESFVCDGTEWQLHLRADKSTVPDFLIQCNENEMKFFRVPLQGVSWFWNPKTGLQIKGSDKDIRLKVFNVD